jgi:hypothetical protein
MSNFPPRRLPLGSRELELYRVFVGCQLGQPPLEYARAFRRKYDVTHLQIARIAKVSEPTVDRWYSSGSNRSSPTPSQSLLLALMDFLWSHYEEIPSELLEILGLPTSLN